MPDQYKLLFLGLAVTLLFNSFLVFSSAYFEHLLLQRFATFFCVMSMIAFITAAVVNEIISTLIVRKMDTSEDMSTQEMASARFACFNTIAQFS